MFKLLSRSPWTPLIVSAALWLPTGSGAVGVTMTQEWIASWSLLSSDGQTVIADSDGGNGQGGNMDFNPAMPQGNLNGTASLSVDKSSYEVRSSIDAPLSLVNSDLGWTNFTAFAKNNATITDRVAATDIRANEIRIYVDTSGSAKHDFKLFSPPYGGSIAQASSQFRATAKLGNDEKSSGLRGGVLTSHIYGIFRDDIYDVNESATVESPLLELIAPWQVGEVVDFSFSYHDAVWFLVEALDAEQLTMNVLNDFSHTTRVFADVYDAQGNWLPGVQITSEAGFTYRNYRTDPGNNVPEPTSLALAGAGLVMLTLRRRRRVS